MKLHEYQARDICAKYGIPVTGGGVAITPAEVRAIATHIPVVWIMQREAQPAAENAAV
jgi:succinyl-CoA synthetase beta subunit